VDLRARYSSADVPAGNTLPLAVSAGFAWGIGFANLIRYPQGPSPELIADYFLSGLVIKGTIRVKVDGLLSPPLGPQSYYAIRHDSRVTIDCESRECLVVARRQKGDHVREVDHGAVEQGDEADER
jgi:hypothetical protein